MKRIVILVLIFFLVFSMKVSAQESITNKLQYDLEMRVELYSDVQVKISNPVGSDEIHTDRNVQSDQLIHELSLGKTTDEKNGCVDIVDFKRTGVCEDGKYSISVKSFDSAGNVSEKILKITRDTVSPSKPKGNLYVCGTNVCFNLIESEKNVALYVNNRFLKNISNSSENFVVLEDYLPNTEYRFEMHTQDEAGNNSNSTEFSIITPLFGGIGGADPDYVDPYIGFDTVHYLKSLNNWATIDISSDNNTRLKEFRLSAPIILSIINNFGGNGIDIYGVGISKNMVVPFKTLVRKHGPSYIDSANGCGTTIPVPLWAIECVARQMGYGVGEFQLVESQKINECGYWGDCLKNWNKITESYELINIKLTNVELIVVSKGENITSKRNCDYGSNCYDVIKRYWHDSEDGKFRIRFDSDKLDTNDDLNIFLKVYGDTSFNLDGRNYNLSFGDSGWESLLSNKIFVPAPLSISEVAVDPLGDASCAGVEISSEYGLRVINGVTEFHEGIDFAGDTNCKISSIYKGEAKSKWYAGNTVEVRHTDKFTSLYGHSDLYFGNYPRDIETGELIMSMGCSGRCTGTHLHFEFYENDLIVDPGDYFNLIFNKYRK